MVHSNGTSRPIFVLFCELWLMLVSGEGLPLTACPDSTDRSVSTDDEITDLNDKMQCDGKN
jgi:hypothetical protein